MYLQQSRIIKHDFIFDLGSSHHTRIKIVLLPTKEQNYAPKYLHPKYLQVHEVEVKDEYVPSVPPPPTASFTSDDTPIVTPIVIPTVTQNDTPMVTPNGTPMVTPNDTPMVTPNDTPNVTPNDTPMVTPTVTPMVTPVVTPNVSQPPETMGDDVEDTPMPSRNDTSMVKPDDTPMVTPNDTPNIIPTVTPVITPNVSPPPETMVDDAFASM